jgi:hypothetical protein
MNRQILEEMECIEPYENHSWVKNVCCYTTCTNPTVFVVYHPFNDLITLALCDSERCLESCVKDIDKVAKRRKAFIDKWSDIVNGAYDTK